MIDFGLYVMYVLIVIATVAAAAFPLLYMIKNFQEAKKTLMGLGGLIVVFLLSYAIASDDVLPAWQKFNITPAQSKLIGGGLICMYMMIIISAVALIYSEVKNLIK